MIEKMNLELLRKHLPGRSFGEDVFKKLNEIIDGIFILNYFTDKSCLDMALGKPLSEVARVETKISFVEAMREIFRYVSEVKSEQTQGIKTTELEKPKEKECCGECRFSCGARFSLMCRKNSPNGEYFKEGYNIGLPEVSNYFWCGDFEIKQ